MPAPLFACPDSEGKVFEFYSAVTGKPLVMLFAGDGGLSPFREAGLDPAALDAERVQLAAFVPGDAAQAQAAKRVAGWPHRVMGDPGAEITQGFAELSGLAPPAIYVLDPNQRIAAARRLAELDVGLADWLDAEIAAASFHETPALVPRFAPVLILPRALEPEDCRWLIDLWHAGETDEGTVAVGASAGGGVSVVPTTKRREDLYLRDPMLHQMVSERLMSRLVPEVTKAFHFDGYVLETFKVGCYKAEKAGFFNAHRDDYSPATKNRKFAVTVNLNTGDYEGGDLRFPEYGPELYRPPRGGAVVFSCSLLHEVVPVTKGHRFVLLTFLTLPGRPGG